MNAQCSIVGVPLLEVAHHSSFAPARARMTERAPNDRGGMSMRRNRLRRTVVHELESANSDIEAGFKHKHAACGPGMGTGGIGEIGERAGNGQRFE